MSETGLYLHNSNILYIYIIMILIVGTYLYSKYSNMNSLYMRFVESYC